MWARTTEVGETTDNPAPRLPASTPRWSWLTAHPLVLLTVLLWTASLVICYALLATPVSGDNLGLMKITESYGALERVALWQRTFSWLPGGHSSGTFVNWPKPVVAWSFRIGLATMFALQAFAFALAWRARPECPQIWLAGPVGAHIIMILMVPSNADVFFYAITGDLANAGFNPYETPLYSVAEHPLYPYNHWIDMVSVYGPVWTLISQGVTWITGGDPASAIIGFKVLFGVTAIAVAASVYGVARMIGAGPGLATAAMVLVAWQPNMIVESSGQAHNDVVMVALVLAAISLTIAGGLAGVRGGMAVGTLSAGVKYVSLPILGLIAITRLGNLRRTGSWRMLAAAWALDLLAVSATIIAVFGPYFTGPSMLAEMLSEPGRLYSHPLWHGLSSAVGVADEDAARTFERATRLGTQSMTTMVILAIIVGFGVIVWRTAPGADPMLESVPVWTGPLLAGWAVMFLVLAYIPVNTHAWYWTWPVVPVALVVAWQARDSASPRWPMQRWLVAYLVLNAVLTLVYHTRIVHS